MRRVSTGRAGAESGWWAQLEASVDGHSIGAISGGVVRY